VAALASIVDRHTERDYYDYPGGDLVAEQQIGA
jgi:hypothetical protein